MVPGQQQDVAQPHLCGGLWAPGLSAKHNPTADPSPAGGSDYMAGGGRILGARATGEACYASRRACGKSPNRAKTFLFESGQPLWDWVSRNAPSAWADCTPPPPARPGGGLKSSQKNELSGLRSQPSAQALVVVCHPPPRMWRGGRGRGWCWNPLSLGEKPGAKRGE